jgi:hypothetical protein
MSNAATVIRHSEPKLLPVVRRVIEQLNQLFVDHFGLLGRSLTDDVFRNWLHAGKTGPSGLRHYVYALSVQLEEPSTRKDFIARAERMLLHLQSGYIS